MQRIFTSQQSFGKIFCILDYAEKLKIKCGVGDKVYIDREVDSQEDPKNIAWRHVHSMLIGLDVKPYPHSLNLEENHESQTPRA